MGHFGTPSAPLHLLIVEDSVQDFELIEHHLRRGDLQFSSTRVDTREELAHEYKTRPPSAVLCDHGNAHLDSFSVLNFVRANSTALPFIVVTGSLDERNAAEVLRRGADDCVLKHRLAELAPAVHRALRLGDVRRRLALAEGERDHLRAELAAARAGGPQRPPIVPICAGCKKIRQPDGDWLQLETFFRDQFSIRFSHGLCPHCVSVYSTDLK